jgi:imidazole glycerol-phosphate synthase subunit HisH
VSGVAVADLGLGNLGSVLQAIVRAGGEPRLASGAEEIARAERVIVPGVAAFGLGMERANALGLRDAIRAALDRKTPVLGICLGMQILFEEGEEDGLQPGMGLLPGRVTRIPDGVQVPHIGWQKLVWSSDSPLARGGRKPLWAYFANSYRCEAPAGMTHAVADHSGVSIAAVVGRETLFGVQFHPEKSASDGEGLLARFLRLPAGASA